MERMENGRLESRVVLTGERGKTRVKVRFDGQERWISFLHFQIVVRLIIARDSGGTGFVSFSKLYPKAVWSLRKSIDNVFGDSRRRVKDGKGDEFIEGGSFGQYRLKFKPGGLLQMTETVRELIGMEYFGEMVLTDDQFEKLCEIANDEAVITRHRWESESHETEN